MRVLKYHRISKCSGLCSLNSLQLNSYWGLDCCSLLNAGTEPGHATERASELAHEPCCPSDSVVNTLRADHASSACSLEVHLEATWKLVMLHLLKGPLQGNECLHALAPFSAGLNEWQSAPHTTFIQAKTLAKLALSLLVLKLWACIESCCDLRSEAVEGVCLPGVSRWCKHSSQISSDMRQAEGHLRAQGAVRLGTSQCAGIPSKIWLTHV